MDVNSEEGQEYITAMQFAQEYAYVNRQRMLDVLKDIFIRYYQSVQFKDEININHNYASHETHFGKPVWVHRKGAISAEKGRMGIVPGSMGSHSYFIKGLGNEDSFNSASHGAGRRLGRRVAKRQYSIQDVYKELEAKDILLFTSNNAGAIEEFTSSYKDIDAVMDKQKDLAEVVSKLFPMLVVIG